jgi:signal transduction histidine kinase
VAPERRNPLAGLRGALQVIRETCPADDARRGIMKKVDHQIVRLNELITDLLQFARPPTPHPIPLSLGAAARTAIAAVRGQHPAMRVDAHGDGDAFADEQLVHHILVNLIDNAAQAISHDGQVVVEIGPGRVLVNDDGPGIPADLRDRVFEPFFTTRTRGTGLGLAICIQAAQAMHGDVELSTGPLPGAAFVVTLPVRG